MTEKLSDCDLCQNIGLTCQDIPKGVGGRRTMQWSNGLAGVAFEPIDKCPSRKLIMDKPFIDKCKSCIYKFISQPHG